MQVLEGSDEAVRQLFETIMADPRHRGVIEVLERQIENREFPQWSMAFQNLGDPAVRAIPGYDEFLNSPLDWSTVPAEPNRAHRLLEMFRRNMRA